MTKLSSADKAMIIPPCLLFIGWKSVRFSEVSRNHDTRQKILVMWAIRFGLLKVPTWDGTQYVTWQMSRLVGPIQLECSTLHGAWTSVTCPRPTIQQNNFQKKEKIINLVNYNLVSSKTLRIQKIWYTNIILIDYKNFSVKKFEVLEI